MRESSVFKSLQSQYSILMLEHQQARNLYEEARKLLNTAKTQHIMQLEEIRLIIGFCDNGTNGLLLVTDFVTRKGENSSF